MKLSILPYLIAGAGLAHQAAASPMRVVVVTSSEEVTSNIRLGRPVANANSNANMAVIRPTHASSRRPCSGMREKAFELSNAFRQALGLPLVEKTPKADQRVHSGLIHIMPLPPPPTFVNIDANGNAKTQGGDAVRFEYPVNTSPRHRHHNHGMRVKDHHERPSFLKRIHFALMALGPWEGRVVAFVLGCGIGVLLRMLWVLAVVSYRMIRGEQVDSTEYTLVCEEYADAEEIFVAPPTYTYADEKTEAVKIADSKADVSETSA